MSKPIAKSKKLIAEMHHVALKALAQSPTGQLSHVLVMEAIESEVALDEWAKVVYETTGYTRWRSIFAFSSVGMVKAKYVSKSKSVWTILDAGREVLSKPFDPVEYNKERERLYREWQDAQIKVEPSSLGYSASTQGVEEELDSETPNELISKTLMQVQQTLAAELIESIKESSPYFFEQLVVKLLLKMGYGGNREEAGRAVGKSGDGGIDGFINEDRLGLDAIYLQAKRWEGSVGEPPIRDFIGALSIKGASKGVFITTSSFTPAAREAAKNSRLHKIVLIDGARLADLMIEHNLGVSVVSSYELKRIDSDFFSEE